MLDLVIVGGGITGLSLAHRAQKAGLNFRLLESRPRPGGCMESRWSPWGTVEFGPDTLVSKPATLGLLKDLDLMGKTVVSSAGPPCVVRRGNLWPLPNGFRLLAPTRLLPFALSPLLSWWGKLRVLGDLFIRPSLKSDQTLAQFVRRRLGSELLEQLAQPLVAGIYAADPEQLSLEASMPQFLQMERSFGGLIKGALLSRSVAPPRMFSLPGGVGQLIQSLHQSCRDSIQTGTSVLAVRPEGEGWSVTTGAESICARNLAVATSAQHCSQLLQGIDSHLSQSIGSIRLRRVAVLNVTLSASHVVGTPQSFLVPLVEGGCFSAVTVMSQKWPGRTLRRYVNLRIHLGGAGREQDLDRDDESLSELALQQLRNYVKWEGKPVWTELRRHDHMMPEYTMGHRQRIQAIEEATGRWSGLHLAGNWLTGVGIGDCIARADVVAQRLSAPREAVCNP